MLPLAIYLTDEYRLLDRRTLHRAVERYISRSDEDITEQLLALFESGDPVRRRASRKTLSLDALREPISRREADHQFNRYLERTATLKAGDRICVPPQTLHPRYLASHFSVIGKDLIKRVIPIMHEVVERDATFYLDLCDESRLLIQLTLLEQLLIASARDDRVGITVSAASKRCVPTLAWLEKLAREQNTRIPVRLVPAWNLEQEVIQAQQLALAEYPVLRTKKLIQANYQLACRFMISGNCTALDPVVVLPSLAGNAALVAQDWPAESRSERMKIPSGLGTLPKPVDLFARTRPRAPGVIIGQPELTDKIDEAVTELDPAHRTAHTVIGGEYVGSGDRAVDCFSPLDVRIKIGKRFIPSEDQVRRALDRVSVAHESWDQTELTLRQKHLRDLAELIIEQSVPLAVSLAQETGKPIRYALEEVRDAVDLAYYYIGVSREQLQPITLHSDHFAAHIMELHGRGVFLCLPSPEQPIAETLGNLTAALVTGNGVIIKPPEAASLTCAKLFDLVLQARIPADLVAFLPGGLREIGDWLFEDYRIDGVVYTGLGVQGSQISQKLASRPGAQLIPIMVNAEGQSIVMVDSDQKVHDLVNPIMEQAVSTAGQYPLSSHVVYLEEQIADEFESALVEAISLINMNHPLEKSTDLGPVCTQHRLDALFHQIERMRVKGRIIAEQKVAEHQHHGLFVPPTIIRLYTLDELQEVIPGPILYLIRFERTNIARVLNEINRTGYGLALSLFTGDQELAQKVGHEVRVGNLNFNHPRPQGSAGALPIGGVGPSGTGPQIGGPNYLLHFTCERTRVTLLR